MCIDIRWSGILEEDIVAYKQVRKSKTEPGKFISLYSVPGRLYQYRVEEDSDYVDLGTVQTYVVGTTVEDEDGIGFYAYIMNEDEAMNSVTHFHKMGWKDVALLKVHIPKGTFVYDGLDCAQRPSIIAKRMNILEEVK